MLELFIYFIIGTVQEMLSTIDLIAVQKNRPYLSAVVGFTNEITGWVLFLWIFKTAPTIEYGIVGIVAYAMGNVGVIIVMRYKQYAEWLKKRIKRKRKVTVRQPKQIQEVPSVKERVIPKVVLFK